MAKIIGVRFKQAGKIFYFSPGEINIKLHDKVIVETARGMELGRVVTDVKEATDDKLNQSLKTVTRIATVKDLQWADENKNREIEAMNICREKVRKHELQMKIIDVEFTFDNNKVMFYFTADGRIDFRELVKDLASVFRTRIELRQIGVRDETKIRGGIGICGRELCCNKYLTDFSPVSIKMAKDQSLSLNPTKISGVCGRLMCCLSNEEDTYEELNGNLPAIGSKVKTKDGLTGEVLSVGILRQNVKVLFIGKAGEREYKEFKVEELSFKNTRKQQLSEQNNDIGYDVKRVLDKNTNDSKNGNMNPKENSRKKPNKNFKRNNHPNKENENNLDKSDNRKHVKKGKTSEEQRAPISKKKHGKDNAEGKNNRSKNQRGNVKKESK